MTESSRPARRTRAHPSPGGLKELPQPKRKPRQTRKKQAAEKVASASTLQVESSQDFAFQSASSRPSSRESISESSQHIPESRSTSPPQLLLPASAPPIINNHKNQDHMLPASNSFSSIKKRTLDSEKAEGQRPTKRSRGQNVSRTVAESRNIIDSSSDAELLHPRSLTTSSFQNNISEAEDDESSTYNLSSSRTPQRQRQFLTPKPKRSNTVKSTDKNATDNRTPKATMMTSDIKERERIYFEKFGKPMPIYNPLLNSTRRRGTPALPSTELNDNDSEEDLGEEYIDGPSFTEMAIKNMARHPDVLARRRDERAASLPKTSNGSEMNKKQSASRPSTTSLPSTSNYTKIVIPATGAEQEYILTRPDHIDATKTLIKWAERNNQRTLPSPKQLEAMLDSFLAQEQANSAKSPSHSQQLMIEPRAEQDGSNSESQSDGEPSDQVTEKEYADNQSEVHHTTQEPQTPRPAETKPQESRGIWAGISAVKNLMSTPLHFFGRRSDPADATNETPVTGKFSFRHPDQLPKVPEVNATPSRPPPRKPAPQTERRRRPLLPLNRGAQSERRRTHREETEETPIHLRGLLSKAKIAEIQRAQDRQNGRDALTAELERASSDDLHDDSTQTPQVGEKRKRTNAPKTPPIITSTFRVPSPTSSEDDTDTEEEMEDEVQRDTISDRNIQWPSFQNTSPRVYHCPNMRSVARPMAGLADPQHIYDYEQYDRANPLQDESPQWRREQYARMFRIPMHQVPTDDLLLQWYFEPKMMWNEFCKAPRSFTELPFPLDTFEERLYEAEEAAANEAGLPLWPGISQKSDEFTRSGWKYGEIDSSYQKDKPLPAGSKLERPSRTESQRRTHLERLLKIFDVKPPMLRNGLKFYDPFSIPHSAGQDPAQLSFQRRFEHFRANHLAEPPKLSFPPSPLSRPRDDPRFIKKPRPMRKTIHGPTLTMEERGAKHQKELEEYRIAKAADDLLYQQEVRDGTYKKPESLYGLKPAFGYVPKHKDNGDGTFRVIYARPDKILSSSAPAGTNGTPSSSTNLVEKPASSQLSHAESIEMNKLDKVFGPRSSLNSASAGPSNIFGAADPSNKPVIQIPTTFSPSAKGPALTPASSAASGPLEQKKWTQTPPPKPRPGNAQLPQQQDQTVAAESPKPKTPNLPQPVQTSTEKAIAKARAYVPSKPSQLRNVTQMSPAGESRGESEEGENVERGVQRLGADRGYGIIKDIDYDIARPWDPEVYKTIMAIPEDDIVAMTLPREFYENWPSRSEVEQATDTYFR